MAAGSAQATDGYAADGEAIVTGDEASGRPSAPRRRGGGTKGSAARKRRAAWMDKEAVSIGRRAPALTGRTCGGARGRATTADRWVMDDGCDE